MYFFPFLIAFFVAPLAVAFTYHGLHIHSETARWIVGLTSFFGLMIYLCHLLNKLFKDRVVFRRRYRT